uniref:Zinc finger protein 414 n=1 Tax=Junco hyemalis TaxID=40217 RepID=A0A8C5J5Z6_JUNHY
MLQNPQDPPKPWDAPKTPGCSKTPGMLQNPWGAPKPPGCSKTPRCSNTPGMLQHPRDAPKPPGCWRGERGGAEPGSPPPPRPPPALPHVPSSPPSSSSSSSPRSRDSSAQKMAPRPPRKHYQCSSYGCKLAFPSMQELMDHLKVHYRPTQSLEGKTFQCPTLGCSETFPSMQDLMAHMKVHYKPNRYFKCENCLLRFRTHRSLFKHLHVCSDSASGPAPPPRPVLPSSTSSPDKEPPAKPPEALPKPPEKEAPAAGADSAPAALPGSLEPRFSAPAPSSVPGPFLPYVPPSPYGLAQPPAQHRLRPFLPGHGPPSVSNAVWKKSQGESGCPPTSPPQGRGRPNAWHSSAGRIVWEHTRGRYSCTQCPFSTASRDEMTLHTEDHRKNPPPGRAPVPAAVLVGKNFLISWGNFPVLPLSSLCHGPAPFGLTWSLLVPGFCQGC